MEQFLLYVDEVCIMKQKEVSKPILLGGSLDELEIYYQKINMYYSFSKLFNLDMDIEWVYSERMIISEDINNILVHI